ncbi:MAG: hypothetical protein ACK4P4_08015 [Allorhizobium sp.]|uniref:Uncharacterized protein n=1 Tax=Rhizobium rosettiformans TaxID=1368430 RepID=A0ABX7ERT9_9HYPH|nr:MULTISPECIES: hypothetical protein [Rhizobium/Agrobacterium group]AOG10063.1 hypothetical protein BSY240_3788 [Agrobacterium sp. RAC06]ODS53376.1 MAG: hypothetical protein ABS40_17135 [Agrobacterium sp. SCN 61-19]QGG91748.1 hypothetical protein GH983_15235 [Agrobacterium sp. MA01]QRF50290.1 hypothetical protein D4A92_01935 [Rhizobium rosettiformans]
MSKAPDMIKHRGFPSGMPGTGVQFTIRRANDKGVTPIKTLPRKARPGTKEHRIDAAFLHALWHQFGAEPFVRGNLDAARLSLLFGREVVAVNKDFDPHSYDEMLVINERVARKSFPESFEDVFEV